ncbi:MAG TPA: hypothetical protein VF576_03915, partial [Rubricoccaceae bacterium]
MLPSRDPVRVRDSHRRLAAGLGVSAAVHVVAAVIWLAAGPREIPDMPALERYPPEFVLTDVAPEPDGPDAGPDAGAASGGGDDAPGSAPPPPSDDPPPTARPAPPPRASAPETETLSRTRVARPTGPVAAVPSAAVVPGAPGPPRAGPP